MRACTSVSTKAIGWTWCLGLLNEVFRQGTQHRYAYDADMLVMKMRDAGFGRVIHQSFGISEAGHVPLDSPLRRSESLYIERIK
jgi:hypothetical protein